MESRLSPEQMRVVNLVQQIARARGMNIYLTGGAIRDILTGFPIRDLDFTVQGNPLEFQGDIRESGGIVDMVDPAFSVIHAVFQGIRAEVSMARAEVFDKPGKPPVVTPATINEDLRRRDFTFNALALSLNEGSRGLLLDPFNGTADIEARLIRILHSYAFLEDPARLIRATRFAARFGFELEERTRARYDSAREGDYIHFLSDRAIGYEIEQIAYEEDPLAVMRALESEGWIEVLCPKWTSARADVPELAELLRVRASMAQFNMSVDAAPAVMHFLTLKLSESEIAGIQRSIPHREFVASWTRLESEARDLSKRLLSKDAALNSGAWKILSSAKPEALLFLAVTCTNKTVDEKIKSFFGKWRQLEENLPVAQMNELRITPQLPEYQSICQEAFLLLLDGKLRSEGEIMKFLAPFEPPLPPPPPAPVRRGRAAAKKAVPAAKPAVQDAVVSEVKVARAVAVAGPVSEPRVAVEVARVTRKDAAPALKPVKLTESKVKPVGGGKPVAHQVAAKPTKVTAKPVSSNAHSKLKVAAKATTKRTPEQEKRPPAAKRVAEPTKRLARSGKPAVKAGKVVIRKSSGKKPTKQIVTTKKSKSSKSTKLLKKHSKRR